MEADYSIQYLYLPHSSFSQDIFCNKKPYIAYKPQLNPACPNHYLHLRHQLPHSISMLNGQDQSAEGLSLMPILNNISQSKPLIGVGWAMCS